MIMPNYNNLIADAYIARINVCVYEYDFGMSRPATSIHIWLNRDARVCDGEILFVYYYRKLQMLKQIYLKHVRKHGISTPEG